MLAKHVAILLLAAAVGWLVGASTAAVALALALAALALLARQLFKLTMLLRTLDADGQDGPPASHGAWSRVNWRVQKLRDHAAGRDELRRTVAQQWHDITNALPDAGVLLDQSFQIVSCNERAGHLLGVDRAADSGRRITGIVRNPAFVDIVESRRFDSAVEISPVANPDRVVSCRITPYGDGQYLLIARDVTEQFRSEKIKTDFVANASHELRTPLTVLRGYLGGLADDPDLGDSWREPVAEMNLHVDRMQALVTDLLRLNQFEAEVDADKEAVDVVALLERVCKETRRLVDDTLAISLDCDDDGLLGDELALRSIVTNLLTNAVRFTPTGGHIDVRWRTDNTGGRLSVEDSGIGIDSDEIKRVTERFYRTDSGRARHKGGTGLGLAIVKHALAMHQAHLDIRSEPDKGSVFTCHFPSDRIARAGC